MNSFGRIFRISIFGESHGQILGVLIDGCPPGIPLKENDFKKDLERRKPKAPGTTKRLESDNFTIESGLFNGYTTGAPILIKFENKNIIPKDYEIIKEIPRPGHSDFVASKKYLGFNDFRGGGMFSGRLTLPLVAAGVIAKKIIKPININAKVVSIGGMQNYEKLLKDIIKSGDSIGGIVECKARKLPIGLGEPFFDTLESMISHLVFAIPGIKAIEFGAGFKSAEMKGTEYNDKIINENGKTETNHSGGINGGLSNGNDLYFRVAVRPPSSIFIEQETFNIQKNKMDKLKLKGRHDNCIALRIPVILEAATAIVLADLKLIDKTLKL